MTTVFRVEKTGNYTVMSNVHLDDRALSYKAKGLLSCMLRAPEDWDYTLEGLAELSTDGVDAVRSAVNELDMLAERIDENRERDKKSRGRNGGLHRHAAEHNHRADFVDVFLKNLINWKK